ncbi:MAG: DUF2130 domain-containing protein [Patescibacteria group bacterium]|nr:DUF2130 domain-containing protein [Patescibacteria group bacterium]MCL5431758.1 DUF2130 domain-containing protein [Patescibacteria group bacterium]
MISTIKCPKCGQEIPISEAIAQEQIEAAVAQEKQYSTELLRQMRELKRRDMERELEAAKKIAAEEDKIRDEAAKKAAEETSLKMAEKEKKIADMEKMIEELKRTAQQGSQQAQGEVLELALEELLKKEFPNDTIAQIPKGIRGADVVQEVRDKSGKQCGTILWESKNAKWSLGWITKLKDDQRAVKADIAILLSIDLPKNLAPFSYQSGIWVTNRESLVGLAQALRIGLHQVYTSKLAAVGKNEKMEYLYGYLTGIEFKQRIEGIVDAFSAMQKEIEDEKRHFSTKWARQEKYIRNVIDQTHGMYGDLQGITGQTLPEIKSLSEGQNDKIEE